MFEFDAISTAGSPVTAAWISAVVGRLREDGFRDDGLDDAARIEQISLLETLKSVASAVQARRTADFAASREAELAHLSARSSAAGAGYAASRVDRARRDVGAQIGLARRVSPRIGSRMVGVAKALTAEMPATIGALRSGRIDEYQAMLVVAETTTLSLAHRQAVDAELAGRLGQLTPRQARGAAAAIGYRLDPEQAVRRARRSYGDRCVTLRPAPDTMTYLTALLPAVSGVAVHAALTHFAASATATGDSRSRGALMADRLLSLVVGGSDRASLPGASAGTDTSGRIGDPASIESVSGTSDLVNTTDAVEYLTDGLPGVPPGVSVEIQLVMTDRTLLDGDDEPATLTGYGPIPAAMARHLVRSADPHAGVWLRRLFADSETGRLTDADSRRRLFGHAERQFFVARDQVCRTPWCGAPIRHADHTRPHSRGGPTELINGAGLCAGCNLTKEGPGWERLPDADGSIVIVTPTGHRHRSRPPDPPRSAPWDDEPTEAELRQRTLRRLEVLVRSAA